MKIYFVLYYSYCYGHKYDCESIICAHNEAEAVKTLKDYYYEYRIEVQVVCEGGKEPSVLMTKRDVCDE